MIKKEGKSGQVSIFIVIAVIIVIGFLVFFYIRGQVEKEKLAPGVEKAVALTPTAVKNYVQSCLDKASKDSVLIVNQQGGYYIAEGIEELFFTPVYFPEITILVPIYYTNGKTFVPSKETVQNEISLLIKDRLTKCVDNFSSFKEQGMQIEEGEKKIAVNLAGENINVNMDYPLIVTVGETTQAVNDYSTGFKTKILDRLIAASEYIEAQKQVPDSLRMKHIMDISVAHDVNFEILSVEDLVIFSFFNNETKIGDQREIFNFAVDYGTTG